MPWTVDKPPAVAKNWTKSEKEKCVKAANAVLAETGDEEKAIQACIHAAGKGKTMTETSIRKTTGMRYADFDTEIRADGKSTIKKMSISSEYAGERYFWETGERGIEILSHARGHIRTERLEDGIALLWMHSPWEHLGVLEHNRITNKKIVGEPRFDQNDLAQEKQQSVLDRTLTRTSVGYVVHEYQIERKKDNRLPIYRAVDWEPMEASLVTVPFDPTVGVDRARANEVKVNTRFRNMEKQDLFDGEVETDDDDDDDGVTRGELITRDRPKDDRELNTINVSEIERHAREEGARSEQERGGQDPGRGEAVGRQQRRR